MNENGFGHDVVFGDDFDGKKMTDGSHDDDESVDGENDQKMKRETGLDDGHDVDD